jgi:hypothetical protein
MKGAAMEPSMFPTVPADVVEASHRPPVIESPRLEDDDRALSKGIPSRPLFGLPLARLIPQDIHSVMDYVDALAYGSGAVMSDDPRAKLASVLLGASGAGVSLITDYRLSIAKIIPIEAHEAIITSLFTDYRAARGRGRQ